MKQTGLLHRLDSAARAVVPFVLTLLLLLLSLLPFSTPDYAPVVPSLAMPAVYYWVVFRPDLMPLWATFLIGLIQDLLTGVPLGTGIMMLLVLHLLVTGQRRIFTTATFAMLWVIFALFAALVYALGWVLAALLMPMTPSEGPVILQYALTVASYPCLAWLLGRAQQLFLN
ncbi:rod shape-determining protein MreD [Fodinicurvata halophila]|uniref:Rod shape-determining protein MreD n=1 Tax=Fodinicurvata halophila TaxID=1419723 RepID=A0ABV8UFV9_9PROT